MYTYEIGKSGLTISSRHKNEIKLILKIIISLLGRLV